MRRIVHAVAHSLSARLLGIFLLTSIVYGVASRYAVDLVLDRDNLREMIAAHITLHTTYFLQDLGSPPSVERARQITDTNPFDIRIQGPDIDWASDADFPDAEAMDFGTSDLSERIRASVFEFTDRSTRLGDIGYARHENHSFVKMDVDGYRIMLSSPKVAIDPGANLTLPIIVIISILVLAGCYLAVTWLIRPILWIKEGAGRIGEGDLDYRIPVTRSDDLGDLTVDINRMADDVQGMLEAKQQMLLAISHELRSPLTRVKVALEFVDDEKQRQGLLDDVEEMERLVADLLESERLNTRHLKLQVSVVDLADLAVGVVESDFAAERERIGVDVPPEPVRCEVDETRVRLLVRNLVENALCYTPEDSAPVTVTVRRDGDGALISVSDHGPGMSAEQVEQATEPFYRADPARCRDTGGVGLGLYLCRRIAEAHGGDLDIRSDHGRGTTVTFRLPGSRVA